MPAMKKEPTESDIETGERIKALRKHLGITGKKLAQDIGVTRGAVGNWERGHGIKRENLRKIADHYKISFEWLAMNRGEMLSWEPTSIDSKLEAVRKVFGGRRADHLRSQIDALIDLELNQ